eukprot:scaffold47667_cov57-Cyclotella_meneghiniana.AAC.2
MEKKRFLLLSPCIFLSLSPISRIRSSREDSPNERGWSEVIVTSERFTQKQCESSELLPQRAASHTWVLIVGYTSTCPPIPVRP